MQNRFVLRGIPSRVQTLDGAEDELREFVEDESCWIDRFAWIEDEGDEIVAAIELNLENVRDQAVANLDGREILLANHRLSFIARAAYATVAQSDKLIKLCFDNGKMENNEEGTLQTIRFGNEIEGKCSKTKTVLKVFRTREGGTGSETWKGGILLAQQIFLWFHEKDEKSSMMSSVGLNVFQRLFTRCDVLELGAGSSGLPSMAVSIVSANTTLSPRSVVASDAVDEVLNTLRKNVTMNNISVDVQAIDWNQLTIPCFSADCILFADCVYTECGGAALHKAITMLLRPGGNVVGVLPDFRVGVDSFETKMVKSGFCPTHIRMDSIHTMIRDGHGKPFRCAGGSSKNYRIICWSDNRGHGRA